MIAQEGRTMKKKVQICHLTAVIWKEEGGYVSKSPELGVASAGDTTQEALRNLQEAVALYLENAKALGLWDELQGAITASEKYTAVFEVAP
jgi:predicted RNase H-like HicB family nuclease